MELTPGVVIILVVVVVVVSFVLIRRRSGHEVALPMESLATPLRSNSMAAKEGRENVPLVGWLLERASEQTGIRVADDPLARARIEEAAVEAMEDLQTGGAASISLPFLTADANGPRHFSVQFKRNPDSSFEEQR